MKLQHIIRLGCIALFLGGIACSDNDKDDPDGGKPVIDITVSAGEHLYYGDEITVEGVLTDKRNLGMYVLSVYDQKETLLTEKTQMLLGQSFRMNEKITIPLVPGATNGPLQIKFVLKNSREITEEKNVTIPDVRVPQFDDLYLILENNTVYEMDKNGDLFEIENTFPANARGYFSTSPRLSGLFWGINEGKITSLGKDPIPVGYDMEASYKISFNPYTFDLNLGKYAVWSALPSADCFYILGTISNHWQDGEITTEREKMKMQGFQSGEQRYYSWTPPEGDDPETGMWGEITAGNFRFKRGGEEKYILWDGKSIVEETHDNAGQNFYTSSGGALEIRVYFEGDECTAIRLSGDDKTLEFAQNQVKVNGLSTRENIDFAGYPVPLKPGTNYVYEYKINLEKGQVISSSSVDLKKLKGDSDLFDGVGNTTWINSTADGDYIVRIDLFSGSFYACPTGGYPDAIYLNGWSWAKTSSDSPVVWNPEYELALTHAGNNVYKSTLYNFGWGGSFSLKVYHPSDERGAVSIPADLFTSEFNLPAGVGRYNISVDLKDGLTINDTKVEAIGNRKLQITFTGL